MLSVRPPAGPKPASPAFVPPPVLDAVRAVAVRCGVSLHEDAYGTQSRVPAAPTVVADSLAEGAVAWLAGHSVLRVSGEDASRFLQSQTTNDVLEQPPEQVRWHGYCSPKGRLLATMLAWHDGDAIRLMLPDSLAETIRKRLAMFVLRSRVRLANESGDVVVLGLVGARARDALAALALPVAQPMAVALADEAVVIGLAPVPAGALAGAGAVPRWLLVVPVASVERIWQALCATLVPIGSDRWRWTDVRSGVATIVPATSEQFVPQMLNLEADAIGAVSFTKGCYPGQEVVARSHYLGKLKRRTFLGRLPGADAEPAPGSDVTSASNEPAGKIVAAARAPTGGVDVLYEAQVAAVGAGVLSIDGLAMQPIELPYPLPSA